MFNVLKHSAKPLLALSLLTSIPAKAQLQTQIAGPKWTQGKYLSMLLSEDQRSKLTEAEQKEVSRIYVYPDVNNPNVYYYTSPVVVTKWNENRYSLNIEVQERIAKALLELADSDLETMRLLSSQVGSDGSTTIEEIKSLIALANTVDEAKLKVFTNMINKIKGVLPSQYANLPINSPDEALALASDVLNKVPSTRASVSLGMGFAKARGTALDKVRGIRSDLQITGIAPVNESIFTPNGGITPGLGTAESTEDKLAQQDHKSRNSMVDSLFKPLFGLRVSPVGTVVGIDLYYNLVRGWGYSKDNPYLGAGGLPFEGGDFVTTFPISARFDGRVDCEFKAEVIKSKLFKVEQLPGMALMVDNSMDIDGSDYSNVKCELRDLKENRLSADGLIQKGMIDPELVPPGSTVDAYAVGLNSYIQDKIKQFTDDNSKVYKAAQDLRDAIFKQAQNRNDGWLKLNIPMEEYQKSKWVTESQCREYPVTGGCIRHGWKNGTRSKALGDKWECKEYEVIIEKSCQDVPKRIFETFQRPMKVRGFEEKVAFEKNFEAKASYPITSNFQATVRVTIPNDACFARYQIDNATVNNPATFSSCNANVQSDSEMQTIQNTPAETTRPSPTVNSSGIVYY